MRQFYQTRISEWRWAVLLCIIVWSFWGIVAAIMPRAEFTPRYFPCETKPVGRIWIDCSPWYRFTPTGLVPVTTIDRKFYAPLLGIDITRKENKDEFIRATRFIPVYVFLIGIVAGMTYILARKLSFDITASFVAGLYIGVFKGQLIFFKFMSTIVLPLMIIYGIILLIFWLEYLGSRRKRYLIGYYIFFLLLIGVWEQWVNFLLFLLLYSVLLIYREKKLDKAIVVNGLVVPLVLFCTYMVLKYPTMKIEASNINAEAAYVFSYPSIPLMIEDVVVNASFHISDVISPLIFPWPRYSQAVINDYDMDHYNPFNLTAGRLSKIHYYTLTEWYAALLFAGFIYLTVQLIIYFRRNEGEIPRGVIGPLLVYTGFAAHLPIMYRVWMTIPPSSEFIAYKHYFSILGFSILLGWLVNKIPLRIKNPFIRRVTVIILCAWLIFSNYQIISLMVNVKSPL